MGAVGLPEFDNAPPEKRPEKGLLGIRKRLAFMPICARYEPTSR
ncbi:MAG: hypothetical protein WKF37_06835 [Bryobacteraceae bacterium]